MPFACLGVQGKGSGKSLAVSSLRCSRWELTALRKLRRSKQLPCLLTQEVEGCQVVASVAPSVHLRAHAAHKLD